MRQVTLLSILLFCLPALTACGTSDDPSRPGDESLAGFQLEFADDVRVHTPVLLTVQAVGDAGTAPLAEFSGVVELSLDEGEIQPASIELVDGTGSATVTITGVDIPPTLTARSGDQTGTLTFAIGRFETVGTLSVLAGTLRPRATARVRLPESDLLDERASTYDVVAAATLSKSLVAAQTHDGREGSADAGGLARFDSSVVASGVSLSVDWITVSNGAATGVSSDIAADGAGSILGNLTFEVVDGPLIFELDVRTSRRFDKGMSCVGGMSLTNTTPGAEVASIANVVNGTETISGVLPPGTYALNFDTTAIAISEKPAQVITGLDFDIALRVHR